MGQILLAKRMGKSALSRKQEPTAWSGHRYGGGDVWDGVRHLHG